ncbi:MAG: hypothetical protein QG597_2127 [Actinomycetota bacterium]|nr:hypothetical protein [Actinomycetota bacterium]
MAILLSYLFPPRAEEEEGDDMPPISPGRPGRKMPWHPLEDDGEEECGNGGHDEEGEEEE